MTTLTTTSVSTRLQFFFQHGPFPISFALPRFVFSIQTTQDMMKDGIQTGDGSNRYINCTTKSHFCTILFDYLKTISCFLLLLLSTSLFVLPSFNLVPLFLVPDSNLRDSNASDMTSGSIGNRILINRSTSTFDRRSTHPSALSVFF